MQGEGAQRLLTVVGYGGEQAAQIEARGGRVVDVMDLSLEDAFVAYARGEKARTGGAGPAARA